MVWPQNHCDGLSVVWPQKHWDSFLWFGLKTRGDGFLPVWPQNRWRRFLPVWPQNRWLGFPSLGLKTSSYILVIWASKSPRWFLGLGLKTKQATVYRLRHKTDKRATAWDTHQDLAACFTWKQVGLGFPSLPQNWWSHDGGWCT
jgi:hypothetical protein